MEKEFHGEFELYRGQLIARIPPELVKKYAITGKTKYRFVMETPAKFVIEFQ